MHLCRYLFLSCKRYNILYMRKKLEYKTRRLTSFTGTKNVKKRYRCQHLRRCSRNEYFLRHLSDNTARSKASFDISVTSIILININCSNTHIHTLSCTHTNKKLIICVCMVINSFLLPLNLMIIGRLRLLA